MTRQGVRWRFNHVFNKVYVEALTAVLMVESEFGTELRGQAITIAKERITLWQEAKKRARIPLPRRQNASDAGTIQNPRSASDPPS